MAPAVLVALCLSMLVLFSTPPAGAQSIVPLDHRVIDAEYSKALQRIVTVSGMPSNQLHLYNPLTLEDIAVDLPYPPTCVSISPDGLYAAVGHNSHISYVRLVMPALLKTVPVSCDVFDIVLAGNGYAYAFPRVNLYQVRCVKLETGQETLSASYSIYYGTRAKLHPDGAALYTANNGLSPSDIEKLGIADGTAAVLYDSPYHGDFPMCGDLWMSEDGFRIFTKCGKVFSSSTLRAEDMLYKGSLAATSFIQQMSHSLAASLVASIPGVRYGTSPNADTEVWFHEGDFLEFMTKRALPKFKVNGGSYASHGRFVFFNNAGNRAFVIVRADATSGMLFDDGVVNYNADMNALARTISTSAGDGGKITPPGPITVAYRGSQTVAISPDPGYEIADVVVNGASIGKKSSFQFSKMVRDQTITASFSPCAQCPSDPFKLLNHKVIDAEYSKVLDRIVTVSQTPRNQLHIYHPATQEDTEIDLPSAPTCVSVGPEGLHAAVGHDGWISYVDLAVPALLKVLPVTTVAVDIVLAGNGYVYAFDGDRVRCINLETGLETLNTGHPFDAGARAKLHPGGGAIYTADYSTILKFSIADGTAAYLYDSPDSGDYMMGRDVWMSEDGFRVFTRYGTVFRASETASEDMTYNGSLADLSAIVHLTHTAAAGKVLAIPEKPDGEAWAYNYDDLGLLNKRALPGFKVDGTVYPAHGKFVFVNRKGNTCYFIVQGSTMPVDYGVVTLPVKTLTQTFSITASAGAGGTINPLGVTHIGAGRSITFTASPNPGYKISKIVVDGVSVGTGPTYTFDYVTAGHRITAYFALDLDYFAMQVGNRESSRVTDLKSGAIANGTSSISSGPAYPQGPPYQVEHNLNGVLSRSWYLKDANGLYLARESSGQTDLIFYTPLVVAKSALKAGMKWSSQSDTNYGSHAKVDAAVGKQVLVSVPAGKFYAFPISYRMTATSGGQTATLDWVDHFVPYIGAVKSSSTDKKYETTSFAVVSGTVSAPPPVLTGVSPASGKVGRKVRITGYQFGATQGTQVLKIGGAQVTKIVAWTDTAIDCIVPTGAGTGIVTIIGDPWRGNTDVRFTVTP
ncbi:MAG: IPT/TIG domain-containing protein [Syntrophobacteraceae bacterium]